jgi:hypothetical protein
VNFPVELAHPASKNPKKVLTARNQTELEGLLKIGWRAKLEPNTIEGAPVLVVSDELPALEAGK